MLAVKSHLREKLAATPAKRARRVAPASPAGCAPTSSTNCSQRETSPKRSAAPRPGSLAASSTSTSPIRHQTS